MVDLLLCLPLVLGEGPRHAVEMKTVARELALREFHQWTVRVSGTPEIDALQFEAWMPAHGHGLASAARVNRAEDGSFLVEGVRFHMPGEWVLRVRMHDARGWETVEQQFEVQYASAPLRSLWLGARKGARPDPTNRFADSPEAAALGRELFFDKRLSGDGKTSCATCHDPKRAFTDGRKVSGGYRNAPTLLGVSDALWLFWDGRRDSLWSQALGPIEAREEMGGSREAVAALLRGAPEYRSRYEKLAGGGPPRDTDWVFADAGKFLAAYERTLQPKGSRFDRYVAELADGRDSKALSPEEIAGLAVFLRPESQCLNCHNGPLFTNQGFHNIRTAAMEGDRPDFGRAMGLLALAYDKFGCASVFSDRREGCGVVADSGHDAMGAFKVPTLRNLALTAPYLHDGSIATLEGVVEHYRTRMGVKMSDGEAVKLVAFLRALTDE